MKTNSTSTGSNTNSQTPATTTSTGYGEPTTTPAPAPTTPTEPAVDDFGYEEPAAPAALPPLPAKPADPATPPKDDEEKVVDPATGYGDVPPADDKPADEPATPPADDAEKTKKEIAETLKDLGDGYDKDKITEFALNNKLTKEQVEAYVKLTKEESAAFAQKQEEATKAQRASWVNELKTDPEFGGENFARSVDKVEKILAKYMPDTKKVLTERKGMLPPTLMRDLRRVYDALNPITNFVPGEAHEPKEEKHFLDDLYN